MSISKAQSCTPQAADTYTMVLGVQLLLLCNIYSYGVGKTVIVPENKVKPEGD